MKRFLLLLLTVVSLSASAQTSEPVLKFGFLSYTAALQSMSDYAIVESQMKELEAQYAAEQKRVEDEFNKKYEEFLDGQRDFPQTILQKRQTELQELLDKNIAFKKEGQRLVGSSRGLAFILNTDVNAVPWMNITMGEDVTQAVIQSLR